MLLHDARRDARDRRRRRAGAARGPGPRRGGTRRRSPRAGALLDRALRRQTTRAVPGAGGDRRRATPTARRPPATPTGARSRCSTASWRGWRRRRSSSSTGRSRSAMADGPDAGLVLVDALVGRSSTATSTCHAAPRRPARGGSSAATSEVAARAAPSRARRRPRRGSRSGPPSVDDVTLKQSRGRSRSAARRRRRLLRRVSRGRAVRASSSWSSCRWIGFLAFLLAGCARRAAARRAAAGDAAASGIRVGDGAEAACAALRSRRSSGSRPQLVGSRGAR